MKKCKAITTSRITIGFVAEFLWEVVGKFVWNSLKFYTELDKKRLKIIFKIFEAITPCQITIGLNNSQKF